MDAKIDRINKLMATLSITKYSLASSSGISPSNLNKMLMGEQSITDKTLQKICNAFPMINIDWLKTGEGEMLRDNSQMTQSGNGGVHQQAHAGGDVSQYNNSDSLLKDFISGLKEQNKLIERSMDQTDKSMQQVDKALAEISEQRKLVDRLISKIESQNN